jgi:calcineurin-like phosphoesterase family protein
MTQFATADNHFWHTAVIEKAGRPFADVEFMNEAMIELWNARVGKRDLIYHLGDFSFAGWDKSAEIFDRLNGKKVLVIGNHDSRQVRRLGWFEVHSMIRFTHDFAGALGAEGGGKRSVTLCHYPMEDWAGSYHGAIHLHGHSHGRQNGSSSTQKLDIGVDCWNYAPASFEEIGERLATLPAWVVPHNGTDLKPVSK